MAVASSSSFTPLKLTKTVRHGFPDKPSCMAYDCVQELFAFGSLTGEVIVLGHPGLEARFMAPCSVQLIQFSINKGIIATSCSDNICYFWSIQCSTPHLIGKFMLPPKERGYRRDNPGEVKSIEEHPLEANKILIAYSHGLCIIWNLSDKTVEYRQLHNTLECASWYGGDGKVYVICTSEGEIRKVSLKKKEQKILHQCPGIGSITNFQSYNTKDWKWLLFIQSTVSNNVAQSSILILGEKNIVTSLSVDESIVDILCIPSKPFKAEKQTPKALVVLQNSKLDIFDLQDNICSESKLLPFSVPFSFNHLDSSSWITFFHYGGECQSQNTIDKLIVLKTKLRLNKSTEGLSSNKWPFQGGGGWFKKTGQENCLPMLLVTSHADRQHSITLWLYYTDILEYLFTIETAKFFPNSSKGSEPQCGGASNLTDDDGEAVSLDVKFVSVDMERETIVFVNHTGNVLVYRFCQLQPSHETPNSKEILLNGKEEVDSGDGVSSDTLPWRFVPSGSGTTPQIHLLYHVCCVVNWEDSVKIVPVNSAMYNGETNMLLLGTHIAMVLADMSNNGTIIIDTVKGLKSLGLSSISTCEKRTVIESKKKSGFKMRFGLRKKTDEDTSSSQLPAVQHEVKPLCSSVVDIVYFTTSITEQPSLTIWLGAESGDLAIHSVIREHDKNLIKFTGIALHMKGAIANLIFMNEDFQKIHSNTKWNCLLPDPTANPADSERILNYVIVQTRKLLECHGFPVRSTFLKSSNPISKHVETDKQILNSFYTQIKEKPFILTLMEGGNILLLSLPSLTPVATLDITEDIKPCDFNTLSFNECGQGVYSIRPTEIQRVAISLTDYPVERRNDNNRSDFTQEGVEDTDGPNPSTYIPVNSPVKSDKGKRRKIFSFRTTDDVLNRNDWFTPQQPRYGDRGFSRSLPSIINQRVSSPPPATSKGQQQPVPKSRYNPSSRSAKVTSQSTNNPYERTAQALDERGRRLNKTVETTSKLAQLAEQYAENAQHN